MGLAKRRAMEKYIERLVSCNDAKLICKKIAEVEAIWRKADPQGAGTFPAGTPGKIST